MIKCSIAYVDTCTPDYVLDHRDIVGVFVDATSTVADVVDGIAAELDAIHDTTEEQIKAFETALADLRASLRNPKALWDRNLPDSEDSECCAWFRVTFWEDSDDET